MDLKHKILLLGLLILTGVVRCLHLLMGDHFFIVNPDSHFFRILSKQDNVPLYQSGLAPLIRYTGDIGAILIPPLIGVATAVLIYWFMSKVWDKKAALLSVAVYALFFPAAAAAAAGNVDRDALSVFLVLLALTVYYFSRTWLGALWVCMICALIYLEWSWIGAGVVIFVIAVHAAIEYWENRKFTHPQVLLTITGIAILSLPFFLTHLFYDFGLVLNNLDYRVSEMQPANLALLAPYWFFLLFPLSLGLILAWKMKHGFTLFLASWMIACLIMGMAAYRLVQFMIPAVCMLSGIGIVFGMQYVAPAKRQMVLVGSAVLLLISASFAVDLPDNVTMPKTWVQACHWMRDNTPEDSKVMVWWDYGYWIEDVAERESLTDGSHVRNTPINQVIANVYFAQSDEQASLLMKAHQCDYVVFSTRETRFWSTIESNASSPSENGLYFRSQEDFTSDYFSVVYRNKDVWVLKPICATCGK